MKMMRRSPDERLRSAADCLSRLRGLGPDPMPMPVGRHDFQAVPNSLSEGRTGPVLEPVGGEFQPSFETVHPGGGAYLFRITLYFRRKPTRDRLFSTPKPSASGSFRQSGQRLFQNGESSLKLFIGNHKGHQQPNNVAVSAAGEQQQPFFTASGNQSLGLIGCRQF